MNQHDSKSGRFSLDDQSPTLEETTKEYLKSREIGQFLKENSHSSPPTTSTGRFIPNPEFHNKYPETHEISNEIKSYYAGSARGVVPTPSCEGTLSTGQWSPPMEALKPGPLPHTEPPTPTFDEVERPLHYCRGGIECKEVIEAWDLNFYLGNALKYICRADHKGTPLKDLRKAIRNLQYEITRREKAAAIAWAASLKGSYQCPLDRLAVPTSGPICGSGGSGSHEGELEYKNCCKGAMNDRSNEPSIPSTRRQGTLEVGALGGRPETR